MQNEEIKEAVGDDDWRPSARDRLRCHGATGNRSRQRRPRRRQPVVIRLRLLPLSETVPDVPEMGTPGTKTRRIVPKRYAYSEESLVFINACTRRPFTGGRAFPFLQDRAGAVWGRGQVSGHQGARDAGGGKGLLA